MASDDDDVPLAALVARPKDTAVDSDDDDDLTLADMMSKVKAKKKGKEGERKGDKGSSSSAAATTTKKKRSRSAEDDELRGSAKKKVKASSGPVSSATTEKHRVVESILKRWNYCLDPWPGAGADAAPAKNFITCGFRGLHVGVKGDALGMIVDKRDIKSGRPPTQAVLLQVDMVVLKQLLLTGLDKQRAALDAAKASEASSSYHARVAEIDQERKSISKIKEDKAERDFLKKR
jgi:hypothetical protein